MSPAEGAGYDELWSQLQQPAHPGAGDPRLRLLLAALDQGWHIEDPVYLRPRWGDSGGRVYHFILHRPFYAPRLVTVPEGPAVDRFVQTEALRVLA
jgi:hypothetical protein